MKWLTTLLLFVAAILAGLLVYRQLRPPALTGGTALNTPVKVPALPLVNERGEATTLAASDGGRLRLVFFGYVHCPDVCPTTLASLQHTYRTLTADQKKRLQVQFVTVDPMTDTPPLVRDYLGRFDPAFTGLTGQAATIDAAARALYVANVASTPEGHGGHAGSHASDDADAAVSAPTAARIHGDEVRVITPGGDFVRVYTNGEALDGTLRHDLPALIRRYGS